MKMGNSNLNKAKKAKNDEFYTKYETVEKEVKYYEEHLIDKVIYCNCDDPNKSNFFKYFHDNFNRLKLKELIASCYVKDGKGLYVKVDRENISEPLNIKEFNDDGDFRSDESVGLLKEADIVITNPPFSLFREYVAQLIEYDKKFLVLGNTNAITYKDIFPLIKENKLWQGVFRGTIEYLVPKDTIFYSKSGRQDNDGNKFITLGSTTWWTNINYGKVQHDIILTKEYYGNEKNYPKYDNYDAINVDKVADIPKDYTDGVMGVPISFIGQWNPDQFEILGSRRWAKSKELLEKYTGNVSPPENDKNTFVNGKATYDRIFIKRRDNNE